MSLNFKSTSESCNKVVSEFPLYVQQTPVFAKIAAKISGFDPKIFTS